ncbi:MAG: hypothetical protein KF878_05705 [Planctomycetes bacterium]|nr:hypothetical protein [Planctomycetota bacterium]
MSRRRGKSAIANFDSMMGMLRALGRALHGKDFPALGVFPDPLARLVHPLVAAVNLVPREPRELIYIYGGLAEALRPDQVGQVDAEKVSRFVARQYPRRSYPAVMIGSANGAATHLCAALGIPWLPQTYFIPVQCPIHPDEPLEGYGWARQVAGPLLDNNPDLQLHHMFDPNQDRLMLAKMTYFRVKRRRLGAAYEEFLRERLPRGGTLFVNECTLRWPVRVAGERHLFQFGALGGLDPEEFFEGAPRVERYLERYRSHRRRWVAPDPDTTAPESEWGYEPSLDEDIERIARERGYRVRRIRYEHPERLSPLVADLYRAWYRARRIPADRLVIESFILLEPHLALATGACPFWTVFGVEPSAASARRYVERTGPWAEIYAMLFSHGTESAGTAPIERWREVLAQATRRGEFLGVDPEAFPRDYATFVRYHTALRALPARYPQPGPLALSELDRFIAERGHEYEVAWDAPRDAEPPARRPMPSGHPPWSRALVVR